MLFPGPSACRTQDDALQCLASGDKAQSAMTSLRASAVLAKAGIMVLRVPTRLSAVRARYHSARALSF